MTAIYSGTACGIVAARADALGTIIEADEAFLQWQMAAGGRPDGVIALPCALDAVRDATFLCTRSCALSLEVAGETRHLWACFDPVTDKQGQVVAVAISLEDWTAERARILSVQAERTRFRDFARASGEMFWEVDANLTLVALSDSMAELIGKPASLLRGLPLGRIGRLCEEHGSVPILRARHEEAAFRNQILEVIRPSGVHRFRLSAIPLYDDDGSFAGFRGVARDVETLDGHPLERRMAAGDGATPDPVASARNEFLAAMSHELRTPLNAIIGFAETMSLQMLGPLQPQYVDYARDITAAGRHLLTLIEDVLDVSAIESGDVGLSVETLDLLTLAKRARAMVLPRATAKNLTVEIIEPGAPCLARGDQRRLLQILVNLLGNAVKFTPARGRVTASFERHEDGRVALLVSDTGPGIAPEDRERVFEKFRQLPNQSYSARPEGTGLGLHISRELARLMDGEILLDGAPGGGARFTLLLPSAE